jgi:TolB-like protein/DNA-binding winged helix-turn-helix (wHTH) protein
MRPPPSRVAFAEFEFDPATGELWRAGEAVPVQPQPSRLLALLIERPGDLVSRDEIRQALWGGDTHVEFDRSLNFCVAKLRAAVNDSAVDPQVIETVPTRGYRFIAPLRPRTPEKGPDPGLTRLREGSDPALVPRVAESAASDSGRSRRIRTVFYAVVAIAVVALVGWQIFQRVVGAPKVVVVPFQNETGSPEFDRVAKGVSDATVVKLSELNRLRVIGNASGLAFSFRPPDMKRMGESLGAQYLVLGQMKRDAQRMRIVAHLIRVSDQTHVWANTYDTDVLDLPHQSTIANEIAAAIALHLGKS